MKQIRIVDLIDQHNANKIEIHQINGTFGPLMTNISHEGKLTFYPAEYKIEYVDPSGDTQSIVDIDKITTFSYNKMYVNPNIDDNNNGGNDNHNDGGGEIRPLDPWNVYADLKKIKVLKKSFIDDDQIMHPAVLENGYLVFDISYFKGIDSDPTVPQTVVRSSDYNDYMGRDGWMELTRGGHLFQKVELPAEGRYDMRVVSGSDTNIARHTTMYLDAEPFQISGVANSQREWKLTSPLRTAGTTNSILGLDDKYHFTNKNFSIQFESKQSDSKVIDLDSIILKPLPTVGTINTEATDAVEPIVMDDVMAYPLINGRLYGGTNSFTLPQISTKDPEYSKYIKGGNLVQVGDSTLYIKISVPEDGYYDLGLLAKYSETNRDGMFEIDVNKTDSYYGRYYGVPVDQSNDVYQINTYMYTGGDMSVFNMTNRVKLNKGANEIAIRNHFQVEDTSYVPTLNAVLISASQKYHQHSNDENRLLLPNYKNVYFLNSEENIEVLFKDDRSDVRSSVMLIDNYADNFRSLGFQFYVTNVGLADVNDPLNPKLSYDVVLKVGTEVYQSRVNSVFRPHLTIVATPENGVLGQRMIMKFYLVDANQTQNHFFDNHGRDKDTTTNIAGRHLHSLERLPEMYLDLGKDYKTDYIKNLSGINLVDKVRMFNLFG